MYSNLNIFKYCARRAQQDIRKANCVCIRDACSSLFCDFPHSVLSLSLVCGSPFRAGNRDPISFTDLIPLCRPIAVGAMAATSIACVILVANMAVDIPDNPRVIHSDVTLLSFAQAFGTICFAFGGHPMFPTFQSDMREPSKFPRVCYFGFLGKQKLLF